MRLGLFLTPGAARTAYQVGAVQALVDDAGLRFDVVAASSVGALNGAFVATGQADRLARLWASWRSRDIFAIDWRALLRGALWWAPNLMHNRPQRQGAIDPYLHEQALPPGVRLRINLANLTSGDQEFFEWPGAALPLADGVDASVAVPAAIRPHDALGAQWADGLTVDGFPLEPLLLATGVDRAFVVGVAPREPNEQLAGNAWRIALRALEWNQYSETLLGLERAQTVNRRIAAWTHDRTAAEQALSDLVDDPALRDRLLDELDRVYADAGFPHARKEVEVVAILPRHEVDMFFTDYEPERSRALLAEGRRDALAAVDRLAAP